MLLLLAGSSSLSVAPPHLLLFPPFFRAAGGTGEKSTSDISEISPGVGGTSPPPLAFVRGVYSSLSSSSLLWMGVLAKSSDAYDMIPACFDIISILLLQAALLLSFFSFDLRRSNDEPITCIRSLRYNSVVVV